MIGPSSVILQECNELAESSKINYNNLIRLKTFFSFLNRNANTYIKKIELDISTINNTDNLDESNTKLSSQRGCYLLYDQTINSLKECQDVVDSIYDQLVCPLESFSQNYSNIYKRNLEEMKNISNDYHKRKQSLDKAKSKYINSSREIFDYEQKMNKTLKNQVNLKIEELTKDHDQLLRLRAQMENNAQLYKYEITKINQIHASNNQKYSSLILKIKVNEEARISVIKEVLKKYSVIISNYKKIQIRLEDSVACLSNQINIETDISIIAEMLNKTNNSNMKFPYEVFKEFVPENFNKDSEANVITCDASRDEFSFFSEYEVIHDFKEYSSQYQDKIISEFSGKLLQKEEVSPEEIGKIIDFHNQDKSALFARCFLGKFYSKIKPRYFNFLNYNNLLHLANILNCICLNTKYSKAELNSIYYSIICLSERVSFSTLEYKETVYLCAVLSHNNKLYSMKSFWKEIIIALLITKLEFQLKDLLAIEGLKPKKEFKDLFDQKTKDSKKNKKDKKSRLELTGLSKEIRNFNSVPNFKKPYLDNIASKDLSDILKEFIPYLCQFNYPMIEGTELITELSHQYNIRNDKRGYLTLYLISWDHTVKKNILMNDAQSSTLAKRGVNLNYTERRNYSNLHNKGNKQYLSARAVVILAAISHYFTIDDIFTLFLLNKACFKAKKKILEKLF